MKHFPLQRKLLFGYIILVAVIASMAAILVHERERIREIEAESAEIRQVRRDINAVHRHITRLATLPATAYYLYWKRKRNKRKSSNS